MGEERQGLNRNRKWSCHAWLCSPENELKTDKETEGIWEKRAEQTEALSSVSAGVNHA